MADQAKIVRRQRKGAITRHLGTLERLVEEENLERVEAQLERIRLSFEEFAASHDAYHDTLMEENKIDESEAWFTKVEKDYIAGIKIARQWCKSQRSSDISDISDNGSRESENVDKIDLKAGVSCSSCHCKHCDTDSDLPKIEIDRFNGDPLEYQAFISVFDELVAVKARDDQIKLTRLLQYTGGPAKSAIKNCALIGGTGGYNQARDILQNRFGNVHLLSQKIIHGIKYGKPVSAGQELQQLADDLKTAAGALEKLEMVSEVESQQCFLEIVQRCPRYVRDLWRTTALSFKHDNGTYPKFMDFVRFINRVATDSCDPVFGSDSYCKAPKSSHTSKSGCNQCSGEVVSESTEVVGSSSPGNKTVQSSSYSVQRVCVVCNQTHRLFHCDVFKAMTPAARLQVAIDKKLCYNCLLPGHFTSECRKQSVCSVPGCGRKHTKFIHIDRDSDGASRGDTDNPETIRNASVNAFGSGVYLPIVPVIVNGKIVFGLLDSGSTNTFITESLASDLGLSGTNQPFVMSTLSGSNKTNSKVVTITVSPLEGEFTQTLSNVIVTSSIPARYPHGQVNVHKYPHLVDIPICAVPQGAHVDILIGMDNSNLLIPLEVRSNPQSRKEPFATRSVFGWVLNGPAVCEVVTNMVVSQFVTLENQVEKLWQMESQDINEECLSYEDRKVLELWDNEIVLEHGHYTIPIPWKQSQPNMPNNQYLAQCRLKSLVKRLRSSGLMEAYSDNVQKLLDSGYAERVPEQDLKLRDGSVWYLPHHAVISEAKPGKIRIVHDCAAELSKISLNNQCLQGPDLVSKLISVLLRFRQFRYAIMADIEAMYLQVRVPDRDRNALRFLWLENESIVDYRMTCHLFGGIWCASSSTYALRRTVRDCPTTTALINDTIMKSFYVDDLLRSVKSKVEAVEVILGTKQVVAHGGFNLTKFVVNDAELLSLLKVEDRAKEVKNIFPEMCCKALGIKWDVLEDTFHYVSKTSSEICGVTRRIMLSKISSMYDPLGLIAPIVLQGKILFQEATRLKLSWDDEIPGSLADKWLRWLASLNELGKLRFDRCMIPEGFEDGVAEIHHFSDASNTGYGACSYLRVINREGRIHVTLVASKGRLAPIKSITIPRLELAAAVVAVKLDQLIRRELEIPLIESRFWSDSEIVLAYISNDHKRFKTFVANRVALIRQSSSPEQWGHVSGSQNPADVLSRGCNVGNVPEVWFRGAVFLRDYKCDWPKGGSFSSSILGDDCEVVKTKETLIVHNVQVDESPTATNPMAALVDHYSSYYRLKKACCWLMRFVAYLKNKQVVRGPITQPEMKLAERCALVYVQRKWYGDEYGDLQKGEQVKRSSSLSKMSPVIADDLIVVVGRLKHAPIPTESKYPVILPHDDKLSYLIVQELHNHAHLGTEWVLSQVRKKFWIIRARVLIKKVKNTCITCKKLYGVPMIQKMADLPPERCHPGHPPFSFVGLDIFGPFYVKQGRSEVKRYGCVYTCFNTRAIHIELLASLETDTFINGFVRFVARRGYPQKVWSDNGTNLVGARGELASSLRQVNRSRVVQEARRQNVEWVFNPPLSLSPRGSLGTGDTNHT